VQNQQQNKFQILGEGCYKIFKSNLNLVWKDIVHNKRNRKIVVTMHRSFFSHYSSYSFSPPKFLDLSRTQNQFWSSWHLTAHQKLKPFSNVDSNSSSSRPYDQALLSIIWKLQTSKMPFNFKVCLIKNHSWIHSRTFQDCKCMSHSRLGIIIRIWKGTWKKIPSDIW